MTVRITPPTSPWFLPHPLRLYQQSHHEGGVRTLRVLFGTMHGATPCKVVLQEYFDGAAVATLLEVSKKGRSVGSVLKTWPAFGVRPRGTVDEHYAAIHREFLDEAYKFCEDKEASLVPAAQTNPFGFSLTEDEAATAAAVTGRLLTISNVSQDDFVLVQQECRLALQHWAESAFLGDDAQELEMLARWLQAGASVQSSPVALPGQLAPWPVAILLFMAGQAQQDGLRDAVRQLSDGQTMAEAGRSFLRPVSPEVLTAAQRSITGYLAERRHALALEGRDVQGYSLDVSVLDLVVRELKPWGYALLKWLESPESLEQRSRLVVPA